MFIVVLNMYFHVLQVFTVAVSLGGTESLAEAWSEKTLQLIYWFLNHVAGSYFIIHSEMYTCSYVPLVS